MSRLYLNVMCHEKWQSVYTASTDSQSNETQWEWRQPKYSTHYRLQYMHCVGIVVTLEACLGQNDTSTMCHSLSKLALFKSNNLILEWMADHSGARTSIIGQEIPGSESCSLAINTGAMSRYPTVCDAYQRGVRTLMVSHQTLRLCYEWVSHCLIFWQMYSISPTLTILPLGFANMQWSIGHKGMYISRSSAPQLWSNDSKCCRFATNEQAMSHIVTDALHIA